MKIYAVSDQHAMLDTVVPECDLLIVAGDQCPDGVGGAWGRNYPLVQAAWFADDWMAWRRKQPAKHCIVTWGNHDYCGTLQTKPIAPFTRMSTDFADEHTTLVVDALVEYEGLKIWCSPWSKQFMDWAFMKTEDALRDHLKAVPEGIDIFVTHDPPYGYGDTAPDYNTGKIEHYGSKAVLETVVRVQPTVVICGHFHDGFGVYNLDICARHGASAKDCECHAFHAVTIYNVAQAAGAASKGTLYRPQSRGAVEIVI